MVKIEILHFWMLGAVRSDEWVVVFWFGRGMPAGKFLR